MSIHSVESCPVGERRCMRAGALALAALMLLTACATGTPLHAGVTADRYLPPTPQQSPEAWALEAEADSWGPVQREAAGNALRIEPIRGKLIRTYPLLLAVDTDEAAEVNVIGGLGYVPVTFTGLGQPRGYSLWLDERRVDQSVHGNDFWQTDYDPASQRWRMTFNLPLNGSGAGDRRLRFAPDLGR